MTDRDLIRAVFSTFTPAQAVRDIQRYINNYRDFIFSPTVVASNIIVSVGIAAITNSLFGFDWPIAGFIYTLTIPSFISLSIFCGILKEIYLVQINEQLLRSAVRNDEQLKKVLTYKVQNDPSAVQTTLTVMQIKNWLESGKITEAQIADLQCPISLELIQQPVTLPDSEYIYDLDSIISLRTGMVKGSTDITRRLPIARNNYFMLLHVQPAHLQFQKKADGIINSVIAADSIGPQGLVRAHSAPAAQADSSTQAAVAHPELRRRHLKERQAAPRLTRN